MVLFEPQLLKFVIQIGQMLFDIFEGGPLGHILRKLVQVSQQVNPTDGMRGV